MTFAWSEGVPEVVMATPATPGCFNEGCASSDAICLQPETCT